MGALASCALRLDARRVHGMVPHLDQDAEQPALRRPCDRVARPKIEPAVVTRAMQLALLDDRNHRALQVGALLIVSHERVGAGSYQEPGCAPLGVLEGLGATHGQLVQGRDWPGWCGRRGAAREEFLV